jgi:hypothetical protein
MSYGTVVMKSAYCVVKPREKCTDGESPKRQYHERIEVGLPAIRFCGLQYAKVQSMEKRVPESHKLFWQHDFYQGTERVKDGNRRRQGETGL